jgi:hypothetical protein
MSIAPTARNWLFTSLRERIPRNKEFDPDTIKLAVMKLTSKLTDTTREPSEIKRAHSCRLRKSEDEEARDYAT